MGVALAYFVLIRVAGGELFRFGGYGNAITLGCRSGMSRRPTAGCAPQGAMPRSRGELQLNHTPELELVQVTGSPCEQSARQR